jgi:hypothetical protein
MFHVFLFAFSRYDLELWTVAGPVRSGLKIALDEHPEIKAILMGTRRSDPHAANLQAFQVNIATLCRRQSPFPRSFFSIFFLFFSFSSFVWFFFGSIYFEFD